MNLDTSLERARALKPAQKKTGAQLYNTIEFELDAIEKELAGESFMGKPDAERRAQLKREHATGEAALAVIEDKIPGVKAIADEITSHPRSLSARAERNLDHESRQALGLPAEPPNATHDTDGEHHAGSTAVATRRKAVPGHVRRRIQHARVARSRPRGRSSVRQARTIAYQVDTATGNWGSVASMFLIGGLLLSILLLSLRHAGGIAKLETGVTTAIGWVVNPGIDPLRPPGASKIPAPRGPINQPGQPTPAGGLRP